MKLAVAGKGGVGKTTIAALLVRLAADRGVPVVAVDADSSPNLGLALGLAERERRPLPVDAVVHRLDGPGLRLHVDDLLQGWGEPVGAGCRLLTMGAPAAAGAGCLCAGHSAVAAVLRALSDRPGWLTVVDLEASPEHLSRGTVSGVDALAVVTEPYYRSLEAARLLARLALQLGLPTVGLLLNKARGAEDLTVAGALAERSGARLLGAVPYDEATAVGDGAGHLATAEGPVADGPVGDGPVAAAVSAVAERLGIPGFAAVRT